MSFWPLIILNRNWIILLLRRLFRRGQNKDGDIENFISQVTIQRFFHQSDGQQLHSILEETNRTKQDILFTCLFFFFFCLMIQVQYNWLQFKLPLTIISPLFDNLLYSESEIKLRIFFAGWTLSFSMTFTVSEKSKVVFLSKSWTSDWSKDWVMYQKPFINKLSQTPWLVLCGIAPDLVFPEVMLNFLVLASLSARKTVSPERRDAAHPSYSWIYTH